MKKLLVVLGIVAGVFSGAWAVDYNSCANFDGKKCYYDGVKAASYAYRYGKDTTEPFYDFSNEKGNKSNGGDCTNFASQAILSGLIGDTYPDYIYDKRSDFSIDKKYVNLSWYYISLSKRGSAWTSANWLYKYALKNKNTYKGMHFSFVTEDNEKQYLDTRKVKLGDIIFADWENDGTMDHTMIVTRVNGCSGSNYGGIRVAYHNYKNYPKEKARSLSSINRQYHYKATFHIFRPTFYWEYGYGNKYMRERFLSLFYFK